MHIKTSGKFDRQKKDLLLQQPELKTPIFDSIRQFQKNPKDTRLGAHPLKRKMTGTYAFSVTDDIRIIFEKTGPQTVRFIGIGTHPQMYPGYRKTSASMLNDA